MRIAHVTDFYLPRLGGIETHVAGLAERQRRCGHEVDVIAAGGVVESSDPELAWVVPTEATFDSFHRRSINGAAAAVLGGGYDAVHVHAGLVTPLAFNVAGVASAAGLPTVVTVHSVIGRLAPVYRGLELFTGWRQWPVAWTAVSELAADPLRRLLGGGRTVDVVHNAIDADAWRVEPVPHATDHVSIAAVMRLAPRKRPMQLLGVLRTVRRDTPPEVTIAAVIIGEGSERRAMERYISRHRMADWVTLPGRYSHAEIREAYRHADLFVAPAFRESFGIAALEASAAGLPVVAMQRAGIREFIEHGRAGLLVDDDAGLGKAMTTLIADPVARRAMAAHNVNLRTPFEWPATLHKNSLAYERAAWLQIEAGIGHGAALRHAASGVPIGPPALQGDLTR
jgi:glycosyltransferase involved in cell wall biosynthesis